MKKKVRFCVLMALLLTALSVNSVFAYSLQIRSVTNPANNLVDVAILSNLSDDDALSSMDFNLFYDSSVLQYASSGIGDDLVNDYGFTGASADNGSFVSFSMFSMLDAIYGPDQYFLGFARFWIVDPTASITYLTFADVLFYTDTDELVSPNDIDTGSYELELPGTPPTPVPLPPTLLLMGSGLIALATQRRRFKK